MIYLDEFINCVFRDGGHLKLDMRTRMVRKGHSLLVSDTKERNERIIGRAD